MKSKERDRRRRRPSGDDHGRSAVTRTRSLGRERLRPRRRCSACRPGGGTRGWAAVAPRGSDIPARRRGHGAPGRHYRPRRRRDRPYARRDLKRRSGPQVRRMRRKTRIAPRGGCFAVTAGGDRRRSTTRSLARDSPPDCNQRLICGQEAVRPDAVQFRFGRDT